MNTNLSISDASILRQKAEEKMKFAKSKKKKSITELDMLKLIHELEVHQIELELVNEEQRLANLHTSEANQKYTDLYDFAPTGYFTLSSQGRILKINHHGAQMLGKTRPKLINSLLGSFVQADSKIYLITFLKEIFQKKNIKPVCDITILSNEKNICHVRLTGTISEDQEQCYVTATDITELKNVEDQLRKNLAKYKVLIDTFPIAITISDPEGNIIESNEKATELLGIAREEHLRRSIMGREWKIIKTDGAVFPPEEFPSVKSLKENRIIENIEMGIVKPGGEVTWINVTAAPIPIQELGVLIAYNDITRRRQIENALLENEERLRLALKASNDVVWDWDIANDSQRWNEAGMKIFGWTEIVEKPVNATWWVQRIHPEDCKRVEKGFFAAVKNKSRNKWQDEYRFRKADNSYVEVFDRGYILRNNHGVATRMIGVMLNISERKKAEEILQESEKRYRGLITNLDAGVMVHAPDTSIVMSNPKASELLGLSEEQMKGKVAIDPQWKFIHENKQPLHISEYPVMQIVNTKKAIKNKVYGVCRTKGDIVWLMINGFPALNTHGEISEIVISFVNITEHKKSITALKRIEWMLSEKKVKKESFKPEYGDLSKLNENGLIIKSVTKEQLLQIASEYLDLLETSSAIYEKNGDYALGLFSSSWCQLMDHASRKLCKTKSHRKALDSGKWLCHESCWRDASMKAIESGKPADVKCNGGIRLYAVPILAGGETVGAINFGYGNPPETDEELQNLSELYQIPLEELRKKGQEYQIRPHYIIEYAKKRIQASAKYLGNLIDHKQAELLLLEKNKEIAARNEDLNQANLELNAAKERAEESDRLKSAFLANMSHEIRTPMNGILGFADLLKEPGLTGEEQKDYIAIIEKSGRRLLNIINQIIDISKIEAGLMKIDISESDLNEQISYIFDFFRHEAESKGIKLFLEIPVADKAPILNTDREKVYAILTNLVKNAIKFTEKGAIVLGYDWVQSNDYNPYIQFYVKDSGIGIPEDRQEAIFERFIQADISDKMAFQGAGLGLAIAKAYVEMLGGKIWVESEAGLGSTFYFTLPHLDPDKSLTKTAQQQTKPTGRSKLGKKSKILLLDDEVLSDSLLSVFLRESCSSVLYAPKGLEAIEICRQHPDIDLILMNINITGMDGLETTRRIREINQDVVIIALSDRPPPYDPSEVLKAGCNRFCLKPVNHSEWLQLLQKTLKR